MRKAQIYSLLWFLLSSVSTPTFAKALKRNFGFGFGSSFVNQAPGTTPSFHVLGEAIAESGFGTSFEASFLFSTTNPLTLPPGNNPYVTGTFPSSTTLDTLAFKFIYYPSETLTGAHFGLGGGLITTTTNANLSGLPYSNTLTVGAGITTLGYDFPISNMISVDPSYNGVFCFSGSPFIAIHELVLHLKFRFNLLWERENDCDSDKN